MKLLVLGAGGMLGNAMIRILAETGDHEVFGTVRSTGVIRCFPQKIAARLLTGIDVEKEDALAGVFERLQPDTVINCVGLIKQLAGLNGSSPIPLSTA